MLYFRGLVFRMVFAKLGKGLAPLGAYVREDSEKWVFTREFEHASVWVDTEKQKSKITWR